MIVVVVCPDCGRKTRVGVGFVLMRCPYCTYPITPADQEEVEA
jgi:uncharacterized protein with PIN domain